MELNDFINTYIDTYVDFDGSGYGTIYQCWDLYAVYCVWLGVTPSNCYATGYVIDLYTQRATNGMLNNFTLVDQLETGCVVVWNRGEGSAYPTSHVAIYVKDGLFFTQNTAHMHGTVEKRDCALLELPQQGIVGIFKPKVEITYNGTHEEGGTVDPVQPVEPSQISVIKRTDGINTWYFRKYRGKTEFKRGW